jgi:hypothetical protein
MHQSAFPAIPPSVDELAGWTLRRYLETEQLGQRLPPSNAAVRLTDANVLLYAGPLPFL